MFLIDRRANGGVALFGPFVSENGLREKYPTRQMAASRSVTGQITVYPVVRAKCLMLGGKVVVVGPLADLRDTDRPNGEGWIGAEVLRKYSVIHNYKRQAIILEKNRFFDELEVCSLTGREPRLVDGGYAISYFFPDSPASRADLKEGDTVVRIGGYLAKGMSAATLHGFFQVREQEHAQTLIANYLFVGGVPVPS